MSTRFLDELPLKVQQGDTLTACLISSVIEDRTVPPSDPRYPKAKPPEFDIVLVMQEEQNAPHPAVRFGIIMECDRELFHLGFVARTTLGERIGAILLSTRPAIALARVQMGGYPWLGQLSETASIVSRAMKRAKGELDQARHDYLTQKNEHLKRWLEPMQDSKYMADELRIEPTLEDDNADQPGE